MSKTFQYFLLYKPFGVLSQFTADHPGQDCLKDIISVARDIYPVGRLDKDSEGLLFLSNDPRLNAHLLSPSNKLEKEYWCQVEGNITAEARDNLLAGVDIRIKGKAYQVQASKATLLNEVVVPERIPPIRYRKEIPDSWISICLTEGKNRQVRRMLAKVEFPVLRLVRVRIGNYELGDMQPGDLQPVDFSYNS